MSRVEDYKNHPKFSRLLQRIQEEEERSPSLDELLEDFHQFIKEEEHTIEGIFLPPRRELEKKFFRMPILFPIDEAFEGVEDYEPKKGMKLVDLRDVRQVTQDEENERRTWVTLSNGAVYWADLPWQAFERCLEVELGYETIDVSRYR